MPTVVTSRLLIVCPAEQKDAVNATLASMAGTEVTDVMTAGLCLAAAPGPIVAYWCSWGMDETTRGDMMRALNASGAWTPRLTVAEQKVYEPPTSPAWGTQRIYIYNGRTWAADDVLTALGLARPEPVDIF